MTETESPNDEETSSTNDATEERTDRVAPVECHETVDPETRDAVLDKYESRCQVCGRRGPKEGGLATLHAHHIERDPDELDEHEMDNLTLLCRSCHSWFHRQSTPDDSPVEITEEDQSVLLPQDIEILRYLSEHGPSRTGDIVSGVPSDLAVSSVRERLWVLMGLDNLVETRDRQVVDKDVETGEWGLAEHIENSARGHIPDDPQLLLQRMEDEQVRQALDRECGREKVTDVLGITRRTTFNKVKRANAYDFPLGAFSRGGRPAKDTRSNLDGPQEPPTDESDGQQRLNAVAEGEDDSLARTETWGVAEAESTVQSDDANGQRTDQVASDGTDSNELREHLRQAIDALEDVNERL
ncbi:HNH endonuclease [Natranaeroarchaeum sulfidigenes]|nr:HNH endonuclease signature motif containing protein [Natranaeroarchaeum sulfidigenes]